MRIITLIKSDIRFQFRYGIYLIYMIFTFLYIILLQILPFEWREKAAIIMIFTDPAAMGLFFMGAIVLFEKSERVLDSIAVSPVKAWEYVLSKQISIGITSALVALIIGISAGTIKNVFFFTLNVFLCSCLFSAIALIIAHKSSTLNQFMLAVIPAEILVILPAIIWLFWYDKGWTVIHPGISMMILCIGGGNTLAAFAFLLLWTAIFTMIACVKIDKMLKSVGGVKL